MGSTQTACIFLGAPGSGKGTQAKILEKKMNAPHISTGDMLRREIDRGSPLGLKVKEILAKGQLVEDGLMLDIIKSRLGQADVKAGFILDGYPRNLAQASALEKIFEELGIKKTVVVYMALSKEHLIQRLVGRLSCPKCGAVYHKDFSRPKKDNVCDSCGTSPLQHRKDDNEDTAVQRLEVYATQTQPLLEHYKKLGVLVEINAAQPMSAVEADLARAMGL